MHWNKPKLVRTHVIFIFAFFINFHSRSQKRGETKNQERFKIADILLTFDLHFVLNPEEYCLLGIFSGPLKIDKWSKSTSDSMNDNRLTLQLMHKICINVAPLLFQSYWIHCSADVCRTEFQLINKISPQSKFNSIVFSAAYNLAHDKLIWLLQLTH